MDYDKDKSKNLTEQSSTWLKTNGRLVGGIFAIIFGALFVVKSKDMLVHMLLFLIGLGLIYYGLVLVNATAATDFIDQKLVWFKNKLK